MEHSAFVYWTFKICVEALYTWPAEWSKRYGEWDVCCISNKEEHKLLTQQLTPESSLDNLWLMSLHQTLPFYFQAFPQVVAVNTLFKKMKRSDSQGTILCNRFFTCLATPQIHTVHAVLVLHCIYLFSLL